MGIEPTAKALPELENKRVRANADAKCDWRVIFRGMWGNVRLRRGTSVSEVPGLKPCSRRSPNGHFRTFGNEVCQPVS
jgi:hypothetical protein